MRTLLPGALLLAAGTAWAAGVDVEGGGRCRRLDLPDGRFAVTYHHSMYDQPVTEEYAVAGDALELLGLHSPSAAVLEYFGITAPGAAHELRRHLPEIVMRVATGEPQLLRVGGRAIGLREFGAAGERLVLRASNGRPCHG